MDAKSGPKGISSLANRGLDVFAFNRCPELPIDGDEMQVIRPGQERESVALEREQAASEREIARRRAESEGRNAARRSASNFDNPGGRRDA